MINTEKIKQLSFYFTADSFCVDDREGNLSEPALAWKQRFEEDRFAMLYYLGFVERPTEFDGTGGFLYQLSDAFFRVLTGQPDIELTRESTVVTPDENIMERLLDSVPFTLGSEYVTEQMWKNLLMWHWKTGLRVC